uniref:Kinetochore protein SPC25 n=1 Tax=Heligmosomoides polygyrus TaxID=6339 RepID=A0A8L8KSW8_HELPZ
LDMLRFERDSLRNHKDQVEQQLDQADSGIRDLITQLKKKDEILEAKQKDIEAKEIEIRELKERLKRVEAAADAHVKKREEEITKQMDNYLQETRLIDAERERHTKMRVLEAQQRLKLVQDERDAALKRAQAAEEKVADYEENFMQYRGQMEGEALRAITNGYRNALSAIPSSRRSKCSKPPADPCGKPFNVRSARVRVPSRSSPTLIRLDSENVIAFLEDYDHERVLLLAETGTPENAEFENFFVKAMKSQRVSQCSYICPI